MSNLLQYPFSILFYLFILVFSTLIAKKANEKGKFSYVLFIIILLSLIAGFRSEEVGIDTSTYMLIFRNHQYYLYEFGFSALTHIFDIINSERLYLFTIGFIVYFFILFRLWELRNLIDFKFSVMFFIAAYYASSLNTMRQSIAIAIIFFGTRYLYQKKPWTFLLLVLLATSFHKSAIISIAFLAINFFSRKKMNYFQKVSFLMSLILIPIVTFIIAANQIYVEYILEKIDYYFASSNMKGIGVFVFIYLFVLLLPKLIIKGNQDTTAGYIINTSFFYVLIGTLISIIGYYFMYMNRIGHYFTVMELIYFSSIWKIASKTNANVMILIKVLILIIIIFPYILHLVNNAYGTIPYKINL